MDPSGRVSAVQSTSLSSSSSSELESGTPGQEPKVNNAQTKQVLGIDLCSDGNSTVANHSCGSDSEDGDDPESKLVADIKEALGNWERKVQKKKELSKSGGFSQQRGHQESGCGETRNVQLPSSQPAPSSASLEARKETDGEREEFKWKLEMVTAELSRSRMEQVKKVKRSAVGQPMVFEVPEFPMEYYNKVEDFSAVCGTPNHWYQAFNNYIMTTEQTEYLEWIQIRTTEFLPEVLEIMRGASQLNSSDLLKCRLVSKSWRRSVDQLIQEPAQNFNPKRNSAMLVTKVDSRDYTQLKNLLSSCILDKSCDVLKPHPFPSRSFIVNAHPLKVEKYTKEFTRNIELLLLKYGMDLHHFGYHGHRITRNFFHDTTPYMNTWTMLTGWLKKMPNLRSLEISLPLSQQLPTEDSRVMNRYPLPKLPKLVAFKCRHAPSFVLEEVLRRNKTIKKLEFFKLAGIENWPNRSNKLKNLSEFSMEASKMSHILVLEELKWPLRKLTLSSGSACKKQIDLGVLFANLKFFQETLQELNLKLWINSSQRNLWLELPQLKNLELFLRESANEKKICYDFLLSLDHLEILKLGFQKKESVTAEEMGERLQVIQLLGYLDRLYESNVWKLFPCLKKVNVFYKDGCAKEFTYSRDKVPM